MFLTFLRESLRFMTVFFVRFDRRNNHSEERTSQSRHLRALCASEQSAVALGEFWYIKSLSDLSMMNGFLAVIIPILSAILFGGLAGLLFSFFTVTLHCNQNVTGLTITTFGIGLTKFVLGNLDNKGFSQASKYFIQSFPCASDNWFTQLFFSYGTLVYLALAVAIITTIIFKKTRVGLSLRAVGENPATADAAGINVSKYRYVATIIGCAVSGLGGLFYVMDWQRRKHRQHCSHGRIFRLACRRARHLLVVETVLGHTRLDSIQSFVSFAQLFLHIDCHRKRNRNERVYETLALHRHHTRSHRHEPCQQERNASAGRAGVSYYREDR